MTTIGDRIYYCRLENHMTQKQLAEKCGMADSAIRKYESGKITPKIGTVTKLAAALEVSVATLMGYEETAPQPVRPGTEAAPGGVASPEDAGREGQSLIRQNERLDSIAAAFVFLNEEGQEEAAKRVLELTQLPQYQRQPAP